MSAPISLSPNQNYDFLLSERILGSNSNNNNLYLHSPSKNKVMNQEQLPEKNNGENNNNWENNNDDNFEEEKPKYELPEKQNKLFLYVCKLLETLSKIKPKDKTKITKDFINYYFLKNNDQLISLYPFFRLLFPKLDRLRATYGIQEVFLGALYTDILSLPETEKLMLKHWKNPSFLPSPAPVGDFVNLVYYIIQKRVTDQSKLTINEVNELLDSLSAAKNKETRRIVMTKIIKQCTAQEQKWIISIILKDLKIGFSSDSFFKQYNPRALDILNSTSSLIEVCNYLADPTSEKYINTYYQLFAPIKPMLVARMTLDNIINTFHEVDVIVETKWDGERIQCHLNNKVVKFFSRNGIDYTYLYGPKLSHLIISCVNAQSAILDGEIVVWDKNEQKYAPFGDNKTVALSQDENNKVLVYQIFDILFLTSPKGESFSLNNVVLSDRKKIMNKVITPIPNKIEIVSGKETNSIDVIMNEFNEALSRAEEGIVIKKADSIYKPDERCSDWVKMKCDYIDTIVDTLDLLVIGGYYGEGKRLGTNIVNPSFSQMGSLTGINDYSESLNSFLLGVIKNLNTTSPRNSTILPIVKVGSGFNTIDLSNIRNKLRNKWKKYESRAPPSLFGQWTPAMADRPDVYLDDPSDSIIFEVKAAEIVSSESFPTKVTLRFPRLVKARYDKSWSDGLKYNELLQYYNTSTININANNTLYNTGNSLVQHKHIIKGGKKKKGLDTLDELEIELVGGVEAKKTRKIEKHSKILENFRDTDTSSITKKSNLFAGLQFLVLSLDNVASQSSIKKKLIEFAIVENGGEKVQNYLPNITTHVIAESTDVKIQNILSLHNINIINSKWVYDCIQYQKILPLSPMYLTSINEETKELFKMNIDKYNDSYYDDVDINSLKEIFNGMKKIDIDKQINTAIKEINKEYQNDSDFQLIQIYK